MASDQITILEAASHDALKEIRAELLGAGRSTHWIDGRLGAIEMALGKQMQTPPDSNAWTKSCITLTALNLKHALDFAAPDFDTDEEQRETQVSIAWAPVGATHTDEGAPDPAGYKVWLTDYPEEGSIPLEESPAGFPVKSAARGRDMAAIATRAVSMGSLMQRLMAWLADVLDDDQFNHVNAMVEAAGFVPPADDGSNTETAEGITERSSILRLAATAIGANPLIADDWLEGHAVHTEADDIIAIWRMARDSATTPARQPEPWQTMPVTVFIERGNVLDYAAQRGDLHARAMSSDGHLTLYVRTTPTETAASLDVLAERARQVSAEGWTPEHDDEHNDGSLARAAACYALHTEPVGNVGDYLRFWPWGGEAWKPRERRRNLVKAGALVLAEIERIDRAAARATTGDTQ